MKCKNPPHYLRYDREWPPPGDSDGRRRKGVTAGLRTGSPRSEAVARARQGVAEEVGLALLPPLPHRSVMVPLDGSPFSEHALPLALEIARRSQARLLVVHVASWLSMAHSVDLYMHGDFYAQFRRQQQEYLDSVVRRLEEVSSVAVTPMLLEEEGVVRSLCGMAESGADLVVMATHGRGPFTRFWCGSVADTLIRQLSIPVIVLRGSKESPDLSRRPAVRRVLVPFDGSRLSKRLLEHLIAWKDLSDVEYTLVHVLDPRTGSGPASLDWAAEVVSPPGKLPAEVTHFRRAVEKLVKRGFPVNALVVFDEDPAKAILRSAREQSVDLIALSTSGRAGLSRLFRKSEADRVIRRASVPVMVFRSAS